jgi:hypothetical protein
MLTATILKNPFRFQVGRTICCIRDPYGEPQMKEDLFNATEVALLLDCSEATVMRLVREGKLPAAVHRRNGRNLWPASVVRAALARLRPVAENRRAMLPMSAEVRA